jgi:hypothetical protein
MLYAGAFVFGKAFYKILERNEYVLSEMNPFLLGFENEYSVFFYEIFILPSCSYFILFMTALRHLIFVFMSFISSMSATPLVFYMLRITNRLKYSPRFSSA